MAKKPKSDNRGSRMTTVSLRGRGQPPRQRADCKTVTYQQVLDRDRGLHPPEIDGQSNEIRRRFRLISSSAAPPSPPAAPGSGRRADEETDPGPSWCNWDETMVFAELAPVPPSRQRIQVRMPEDQRPRERDQADRDLIERLHERIKMLEGENSRLRRLLTIGLDRAATHRWPNNPFDDLD